MTIYTTPFDPETLQATGRSEPSGFESLDQIRQLMGPPLHGTAALLVYPGGVLFSRIPFNLDL